MQTLKISLALAGRGHGVHLLCMAGGRLETEARHQGLPVLPVLRRNLGAASAALAIRKVLGRLRPDIIHTHLSHDLGAITPAIRLAGWTGRYYLTKRMASGVSKTDPVHRFLYRRLDAVFAISSYIRDNVIATCPVPADRIHLMLNGLELDRYRPGEHDRVAIRTELGIGEDRPVVGLIGRLTPKKGHMEFLDAAARLVAERDPAPRFLVVGDASHGEDAYGRAVRDRATELGLAPHITFTGFREDIPRMLAAMDILAFPSYAESFGTTLLEAMAMGVPPVASDSGGVPDIIDGGRTGILVPPKDAAALADGLETLLADAGLRARLAGAGRADVEARFSFERYIDRLEAIYRTGAAD